MHQLRASETQKAKEKGREEGGGERKKKEAGRLCTSGIVLLRARVHYSQAKKGGCFGGDVLAQVNTFVPFLLIAKTERKKHEEKKFSLVVGV